MFSSRKDVRVPIEHNGEKRTPGKSCNGDGDGEGKGVGREVGKTGSIPGTDTLVPLKSLLAWACHGGLEGKWKHDMLENPFSKSKAKNRGLSWLS